MEVFPPTPVYSQSKQKQIRVFFLLNWTNYFDFGVPAPILLRLDHQKKGNVSLFAHSTLTFISLHHVSHYLPLFLYFFYPTSTSVPCRSLLFLLETVRGVSNLHAIMLNLSPDELFTHLVRGSSKCLLKHLSKVFVLTADNGHC